jgi:hypothetical protein
MQQTSNYNLNKPEQTDVVNIEDLNENFDILDTQLKDAKDKADQAFTQASSGKAAIKAAITGVDPGVTIPTDATFAQLEAAIGQIQTGIDTEDATATAAQILAGMTAYVKSVKVTGTMVNRGAVNQSLPINGTYTIPAGYHNGSGKVTQSITSKAAATYNPSTSAQTIAAGQYLSGAQTIAGDSDLVTGNIRAGINIFGVSGKSSVVDTADANGGSTAFLAGYSGYVNGTKYNGTIPIVYPDYNDQIGTDTVAVGTYSGDGANYAYMNTGLNGKYSNGVTYVRHYEPYLRPEYILNNASIMGVQGAAIAGKRFATGTVTSTSEYMQFTGGNGNLFQMLSITVAGLTFKPSFIYCNRPLATQFSFIVYLGGGFGNSTYPENCILGGNAYASSTGGSANNQQYCAQLGRDAYVNSSGFRFPVLGSSQTFTWYAWE